MATRQAPPGKSLTQHNRELLTLVARYAADATERAEQSLAIVFGAEWHALTPADQQLIIRDCTEDGGVEDFRQYRADIGTGNLDAYARTMRVRFSR